MALTEEDLSVRAMRAEDAVEVGRLIEVGLMSGHSRYQSEEADRIRRGPASEREAFLVAEAKGRIVGTLAIVEASQDVGHLHWLRVDPAMEAELLIARRLVRAAAEHAREFGLLKLAMHAPVAVEQRVATYCHQLGFEFSRAREINNVHVMEFYLNLYERPQRPEANRSDN